jgi:hypothetical protein
VVSVDEVTVDVSVAVQVWVTVPPDAVLVSVLVIVFVCSGPVTVCVLGGAVTVVVAVVEGFAA